MEHEVIWGIPKKANWVKITCVVPAEMFAVWDVVCNELAKDGVSHDNEPVRNGMVLEVLAAEFLGGAR